MSSTVSAKESFSAFSSSNFALFSALFQQERLLKLGRSLSIGNFSLLRNFAAALLAYLGSALTGKEAFQLGWTLSLFLDSDLALCGVL